MIASEFREKINRSVRDLLERQFEDEVPEVGKINLYQNMPTEFKLPAVYFAVSSDSWDAEGNLWTGELSVSVILSGDNDNFSKVFTRISEGFLADGTLGGTVGGVYYSEWAQSEEAFEDETGLETTVWTIWKHTGMQELL